MAVSPPQQLAPQIRREGSLPPPSFATPPRSPMRVRVEAVQTVTPWKAYGGDRALRRIVAGSRDAEASLLRSRMSLVLFYKKAVEDGNGWMLAGKLKESLNIALSEEPVLAGRLRKSPERDDGAGVGFEVKFTDTGARLVQARAEGGMSAFLEGAAGGVACAGDVMRLLTYWKDINERDLEYSPLFFIQLTVFEGEGFAIGVNSSLLLSDPLVVVRFLRTWSQIHQKMHSNGAFQEASIFHLGNFRRSDAPPRYLDERIIDSAPNPSHPVNGSFGTLLFRQSTETGEGAAGEDRGKVAASTFSNLLASRLCGNDGKPEPFYLFDNGPDGTLLKVDGACGAERFLKGKTCFVPMTPEESLGRFEEVAFEACHPAHAFYAVDSGDNSGVAVVFGGVAGAEVNAGPLGGATVLSVTPPIPVGANC